MICTRCKSKNAEVELIRHHAALCKDCFEHFFVNQVQKAIKKWNMFSYDDKILIAISGGKDSLSLWSVLASLGYNVSGLFIDLGIDGFSSIAKKKVLDFSKRIDGKLIVIDLEQEGVSIPKAHKILRRNSCSLCGQIKRYYFNYAANKGGFDILVTGHNLDDEVSRLFANVLHWKIEYLKDQSPLLQAQNGLIKRAKPFYRLTEYEIAAYAFFHNIDYFINDCPLSRGATFSYYKHELNRLEMNSHSTKMEFYQGFLKHIKPLFAGNSNYKDIEPCKQCGYPATKNGLCFVCNLKEKIKLEKLN